VFKMQSKPRIKGRKPGYVRIIGGQWRGRRLPVPDIPGLRPSGDRCRETVFNWLQPHLHQARCIDLFAGSGVLGLEAASRGAAAVVLVEKSRPAAAALRSSVELLQAPQVSVIEADALPWLAKQATADSFDIAFVDPPFGSDLASAALRLLEGENRVRPGGFVYVESARSETGIAAGPCWDLVREQLMGEVRMQIFARRPGVGDIPDA
jgi:16S rRNA (guanine966-N2)-methyltransferase